MPSRELRCLFYFVAFRFVTGQDLFRRADADPENWGQQDDVLDKHRNLKLARLIIAGYEFDKKNESDRLKLNIPSKTDQTITVINIYFIKFSGTGTLKAQLKKIKLKNGLPKIVRIP